MAWSVLHAPRQTLQRGLRRGGVFPRARGAFQVVEVAVVQNQATLRDHCLSTHDLQDLTGVHARDLRALNERGGEAFRALIEPRGHRAVLLRMGMFRAVLTAERFLMFRATQPAKLFAKLRLLPIANETLIQRQECSSQQQTAAVSPACESDGDMATSFEMRCLAAVLGVTQRRLRRRAQCFGPVVENLLEQVTSEEPEEALTQLVSVQRTLSELERGCDSIVQSLNEVLRSDEEMLSLLLTMKQGLPPGTLPPMSCHVAVEALLENSHYAFKEVSDKLYLSIRAIEATQRAVQISLESKRTRLLQFEVHTSVATVSLASVATVASIFGMNLVSGLEEAPGVFVLAAGSSLALAAVVYATYLVYLRRRERSLAKRLQRMNRMRQIASQMPEITDVILGAIERMNKSTASGSSIFMDPHTAPSEKPEEPCVRCKDYLTIEDFRRLCRSEVCSQQVSDDEIVALFQTLDSDNNQRLEAHDVAEFLCIQSSPLSGLGPSDY